MSGSKFVYVTYIKTTPAKLWLALTDPKIIEKYWFGLRMESDLKQGSNWKFYAKDELMDSGKILHVKPKRLLVRSWQNEWRPNLKKEGVSRCIYEIKKMGDSMQLTVTHTMRKPNSKFIKIVAAGWPMCISNLKTWLETGGIALSEPPGHDD